MNASDRDDARIRRLGGVLVAVMVVSFSVLLYCGRDIYQAAPPVPDRVVIVGGRTLFTRADIETGQDVWRSIGGQELGSVWGHGAYTAPDWTADWLHRESVWLLDRWSEATNGTSYGELDPSLQAGLRVRLQQALRTNTYDASRREITVSDDRAAAIAAVSAHYKGLFREDPALDGLRSAYAMPRATVRDDERADALNAFFFWAAWSCVTNRPGEDVTSPRTGPPTNSSRIGRRP